VRRADPAARVAAILLVGGVLGGCGHSESPSVADGPAGELVPQAIYNVTIASPAPEARTGASSTAVPATVFVPAHRRGETYPLILHSHGWGQSRVTGEQEDTTPDSAPLAYFTRLDAQVTRFLRAGYAVISFDQRGHGDSTAEAYVMHPDYETRDAIAVVDWAEANLDLARDERGDPRVGAIGGSYGGGFQHNLVQLDPRIDTIIPGATWSDAGEAIFPNGVVKKTWLQLLCTISQTVIVSDPVAAMCQDALYDPSTTRVEQIAPEGVELLVNNAWIACGQPRRFRGHPCRGEPLDVLLVQGQRDVVFNVSQAVRAYDFYSARGGDVRLMTMQAGHIVPAMQAPDGPARCGGWDVFDLYQRWMDAKLRGTGLLDDVPRVCLSLDDNAGAVLDEVPRGGAFHVTIPPDAAVTASIAGSAFVPMDAGAITESGLVLAGMPIGEGLDVTGTAFIGVAVARNGTVPTAPLDEQVTPLRGDRSPHARVELITVAEQLEVGDVPGILILSDHPQYGGNGPSPASSTYAGNLTTVSGTFTLPIVRPRAISTFE